MRTEKNGLRLALTACIALCFCMVIVSRSSAWWWINGRGYGGPPWFVRVSVNARVAIVQGEAPGGAGLWRNVDLHLNLDCITRDSVVWREPFDVLIDHDTLHIDREWSNPSSVVIWPRVIYRYLDDDRFYYPVQPQFWGDWDTTLTHFRGRNIRQYHFSLNGILSLCLQEGEDLRLYVTLAPITSWSLGDPWPDGPIDFVKYDWDPADSTDPVTFFDLEYAGRPWIWQTDINIEPLDIPPASQIKFAGYYTKNGVAANDWLPVPDSLIGIAVKYVLPEATGIIGYTVWDVSTWQGVSMNHPRISPIPNSVLNTEEYFDFAIANREDYDISIVNYDEPFFMQYSDSAYYDSVYKTKVSPASYSHRGWRIYRTEADHEDTLWLRALDYAAKAIISPITCGKERYRMNFRDDAAGRNIWTISAPRDDDGYYTFGSNRGDHMADAWEEDYSDDIYSFLPFGHWSNEPYPPTDHPAADQDAVSIGRIWEGEQLYGDKLCNWMEYRGFWTNGSDSMFFAAGRHQRTNPLVKTVFGHVTTQVPDSIKYSLIPGHIWALSDSFEVYFTDSIESFNPLLREVRMSNNRTVSLNMYGAERFYYGYPSVTIWPFYDAQNAVAYWIYDNVQQDIDRRIGGGRYLGATYGSPAIPWREIVPDALTLCPSTTMQVVINYNAIREDLNPNNYPYYNLHMDSLKANREWLFRQTVAHEFGHSVGMSHYRDSLLNKVDSLSIMSDTTLFKLIVGGWKLKTDTVFYDSSSFKKSLIRLPREQ